jgi:hypothetical protein
MAEPHFGVKPCALTQRSGAGGGACSEGDRAGGSFSAFESRLLDQKCRNDPVDDLQDGCEQIGMCGEELT